LAFCPAIFDRDVLALDVAFLLEPPPEASQTFRVQFRRCATEKPDYRHRRLLRTRHNRPRARGSNSLDEIASPHRLAKTQDHANYIQVQQGFAVREMGFGCSLRGTNSERLMSALAQKRTSHQIRAMSALPQKRTSAE
jgi:hypothetical protein